MAKSRRRCGRLLALTGYHRCARVARAGRATNHMSGLKRKMAASAPGSLAKRAKTEEEEEAPPMNRFMLVPLSAPGAPRECFHPALRG